MGSFPLYFLAQTTSQIIENVHNNFHSDGHALFSETGFYSRIIFVFSKVHYFHLPPYPPSPPLPPSPLPLPSPAQALPHGTVVLGRKSDRGECRLITCVVASDISGEANEVVFPVPAHPPSEPRRVAVDGPNWAKYVRGVVALMNEKGDVPAFNAVIASSVPLGGGLSSSAALEVATCLFVRQLCRAPGVDEEENEEEKKRLALVCQEAEHRYAGMPCGIMDQFVSMLAREGHALLIDCQ